MTHHIRVATLNFKRCGWDDKTRFHNFDKLVDTVATTTARPPHILCLPEATMLHAFNEQPLWELIGELNALWCGKDVYYPFLTAAPGHRHHPLLLTSARQVPILERVRPGRDVREIHEWTVVAVIAGRKVRIKPVHWSGSHGPKGFAIQSARDSQLAAEPSLLLGDFNATSSCEGEYIDLDYHERFADMPWKWTQKGVKGEDGRWMVDTEPMDDLLKAGFIDSGQQAGDFTVTSTGITGSPDRKSGLRIDRIAHSRTLRATQVPGKYRVISVPESDHDYVIDTLDFDPTEEDLIAQTASCRSAG